MIDYPMTPRQRKVISVNTIDENIAQPRKKKDEEEQ